MTSPRRYRYFFFARLTLFACFASAVRVFFGSFAIVFSRRAAAAAFFTFFRAAAFCFFVAMRLLSVAPAARQQSRRIKNVSGAITATVDVYGSGTVSP